MEEAKSLDYYESQKAVCNMGITQFQSISRMSLK